MHEESDEEKLVWGKYIERIKAIQSLDLGDLVSYDRDGLRQHGIIIGFRQNDGIGDFVFVQIISEFVQWFLVAIPFSKNEIWEGPLPRHRVGPTISNLRLEQKI